MSKVTPYNSTESKKKQVTEMFNNIAGSYDFLNHSLSFGMDNLWRKIAIKKITNNPKEILDIATGTADFAISATKYTDAKIIGIDISEGMLKVGKEKIAKKRLKDRITLQLADSEDLPFKTASFDAVTAGFGVRNFENLQKGLKEIYRVLKSDGAAIILWMAYAMVSIYGLSNKIGNISYYDSSGQQTGFTKPYSEDRAQLIDKEVSKILDTEYKRAKDILLLHKDKVKILSENLLENEVIFKDDLIKIFGERKWKSYEEEQLIKMDEVTKKVNNSTKKKTSSIKKKKTTLKKKNGEKLD